MLKRDASKTPMFLGIDARAVLFIIPSLFHFRLMTTGILDLLVIVFFIVLRVKKLNVNYAYRKFRTKLRGATVSARPWWFLKKWRNR